MAAIALQLWSVRDEFQRNPQETLRQVGELGYAGVELVDSITRPLVDAKDARETLARYGLAAVSYHVNLRELEQELSVILRFAAEVGCPQLVCAWIAPDRRRQLDDYADVASSLESIAQRCRDSGVALAYHHHDFEVRKTRGRSGLETICERVDAELLSVEADVYWLHAAGEDPVSYLTWLGDRCELLHLKDHLASNATPVAEDNEGVARFNVELGEGIIDLDGVLAATSATAQWYIVEQDISQSPLTSARRSMAFLTSRGLNVSE